MGRLKRLETELLGLGMLLGFLNQINQEHKILQYTDLSLERACARQGRRNSIVLISH